MNLIETRISTSVRDALQRSGRELLPEEILGDNLVSWVLNFGRLDNGDEYRRQRDYYEGDLLAPIISEIVQSALSPQISFYYASLFHLGRQWQVSDQALQVAEQALAERNFERSINENIQIFLKELQDLEIHDGEYRSIMSTVIKNILQRGHEYHLINIQDARTMWQIWRREVRELREITERCSVEYNKQQSYLRRRRDDYRRFDRENERENFSSIITPSLLRLIAYQFSSRELYNQLHTRGVKVKNTSEDAPSQKVSVVANLVPLFLLSQPGIFEVRRFLEEYARLLKEETTLIEKRRFDPIVRQIEEQLLREFSDHNPFDQYRTLKKPPDLKLKAIWDKCQLPHNEIFFFAKQWRDSLDPEPSYSSWSSEKELPYKSALEKNDVISFARSADSTIKRKWTSTSRRTGETKAELIQRLFEQEWVAKIVQGAVYPTKEKKGQQKWSDESFHSLVTSVVDYLNGLGYSLTTPTLDRIRRLWSLAIKGELQNSIW